MMGICNGPQHLLSTRLALFALAADPAVLTHALAPAVPADAPDAIMLADARAPAVLAGAPDAVMLADARAPAVLAPVIIN